MNNTLIVGAVLLLGLALYANKNVAVPLPQAATAVAPPTGIMGFSFGGAGLNASVPGSAITTVNSGIVVANNALGFFNSVSSLWSDDGSDDY